MDPSYINALKRQTEEEVRVAEDALAEFAQLRTPREMAFEGHWEEVAELIDPPSRNTFTYGSQNTPGEKKTDKQVDATGMQALERFKAICDSLITPRNQTWHTLAADNPYLMKNRRVQLFFEEATRALFKHRYAPNANFSAQNQGVFHSLGAYGTGSIFVDRFQAADRGGRGLRYKSLHLGSTYFRENHQGLIDGLVRVLRMTARQMVQKWTEEKCPPQICEAFQKRSENLFEVIHLVTPRADYEPENVMSPKSKPFKSVYVSMTGKWLLEHDGYFSFPVAASRYIQTPGEVYGRSPAMQVLPALKTLNAEKRTFLKQGHRAADPVLLTVEGGLVDFSMRPGAMNPGGMAMNGTRLVDVLPTGEIQISKEMMAEEKMLINDAFLVTLFQILTETPTMTATEVIERTNEKGILLAPTIGRQQSEYLGPLIAREVDVLSMEGLLPPMPPELREANGEYTVIYTSPLSRAMRAQEAAGFMRTVESVKEIVNITQDPSLLDPFNFDTAIPAIAEINAVPPSWMAGEDEIKQKRAARADAQAKQQAIQAAPGQAAMMKAEAAAAEAQPAV